LEQSLKVFMEIQLIAIKPERDAMLSAYKPQRPTDISGKLLRD